MKLNQLERDYPLAAGTYRPGSGDVSVICENKIRQTATRRTESSANEHGKAVIRYLDPVNVIGELRGGIPEEIAGIRDRIAGVKREHDSLSKANGLRIALNNTIRECIDRGTRAKLSAGILRGIKIQLPAQIL